MQHEPQLSAEQDRKFDEEFYGYKSFDLDMRQKAKHFLATALEEQKKMYVEEVEELNVQEVDTWKKGIEWNGGYESAINDVLAILNGKETNE